MRCYLCFRVYVQVFVVAFLFFVDAARRPQQQFRKRNHSSLASETEIATPTTIVTAILSQQQIAAISVLVEVLRLVFY